MMTLRSPGAVGRLQIATRAFSHSVIYHEDFQINPIPSDHRFPMPKDHLLYERLQQLGLADRTFTPSPPDVETLCLVHDRDYVTQFMNGTLSQAQARRIGLPMSEALVQRTLIGVGSAILAARLALQYGVAVMCNGGTHHAHRSFGSGWCIFNDQGVAARSVQRDAGVGRVLLCDLDVHQGDGTAAIFSGDPSVYTLSFHCAAQPFPADLQRSSQDVALPAGCTDDEYLSRLNTVLPDVLRSFDPDLVLYNAGVDVHADDSLGKMALTTEGILERDRAVMRLCCEAGVPVAAAIGGGYQHGEHERIVDRHVMLHRAAAEWAEAMLGTTKVAKKAKFAQRVL